MVSLYVWATMTCIDADVYIQMICKLHACSLYYSAWTVVHTELQIVVAEMQGKFSVKCKHSKFLMLQAIKFWHISFFRTNNLLSAVPTFSEAINFTKLWLQIIGRRKGSGNRKKQLETKLNQPPRRHQCTGACTTVSRGRCFALNQAKYVFPSEIKWRERTESSTMALFSSLYM